MNHIEFSVARLRMLWNTDWDQPEFLAEVAYLYDQVVQTGTHEPIIDMGMKLMIPFAEVGKAVTYAMEMRYISMPKKGTWGGAITAKARKVLGQSSKAHSKFIYDSADGLYLLCPECHEYRVSMVDRKCLCGAHFK